MTDELPVRLYRLGHYTSGHDLPAELERRLHALLDECSRAVGGETALQRVVEAPPPLPEATVVPAETLTLRPDVPIRIWCDGSCAPNPGPGGWGAIVERDGRRLEFSGASARSTNNIMEMTAAIEALKRTPAGSSVHITTDSRYLMDGITRWLPGWKRKNWRKADGHPVLNRSFWQSLDTLLAQRRATWSWVPGHSGHPENERCDRLANEARRSR
jgi:ribonuclease HI